MKEAGVVEWLLEKEQPSVRYLTLTGLLDRRPNDKEVREAHSSIGKKGWARDILSKQKRGGYWESPESLYVPKYTATNWMALILSDLGLTKEVPRIRKTAELIIREWLSDEEMEKTSEFEVCVIGNTARMLTRFGYATHPKVRKLFQWLISDQKEDGGWHCFDAKTGTLDCWEALAAFAVLPPSKRSRRMKSSIEQGVEFYLERKMSNEGRRYAPWFRFHYPNHYYYDILLGLDIVTGLGYGDDRRLRPALDFLEGKRRRDGRWHLDRVHPDIGAGAGYPSRELKSWLKRINRFSLEQEGSPSKWITMKALTVLKRTGRYAP